MISLPWMLVAVGALYVCTAKAALSLLNSQKVLGGVDETPALNQPSFGVGFDLTPSYGTAAVSYPNGTFVKVAKIPGNDDYVEVLQRLSLDSSKHLAPPYEHIGDGWDDSPREFLRSARKALGLAASPDVFHLATMISDLQNQVEELIGTPIDSATMATLRFPALYLEDVHDIFEYLGLTYLPYRLIDWDILYDISAAFAGYGQGLCSNYTDVEACRHWQDELPTQTVMTVLFTTNILTVTFSVVNSAYFLYEKVRLMDFDLGYDARDHYASDEQYWNRIELKIEQILIETRNHEPPTKLLLMGDCIGDENFRRVLKQALNHHMSDLPEIFSDDGEVVAAKGAAEFAKRYPYRYM